MRYRSISRKQSQERGQTIALVALTIVTLLAMAALAIDVVTLYVAKGEVQRAADAAALVAAKAFVDSGVTSDPANASLQTLAENMANAGITAILPQNKVAGAAPALVGTPTFDFSTARPGNPQVTVSLQRTGLPIFFARIWRSAAATVTASAKAEAYNPANSQTKTGNYIPIAPKCVKPLLVTNQDPAPGHGGVPFVSATTGAVTLTGTYPAGVIGETITLSSACSPGNKPCSPPLSPGPGKYVPAIVTPPASGANLCPSCIGSSDFEQSIECCDVKQYSCGGTTTATVDMLLPGARGKAEDGLQCLIHSPSRDTLDTTNFLAGSGPPEITAHTGAFPGSLVTTSNSIATLPIFDGSITGNQVKVVGFLQVFINNITGGAPGTFSATVLNVIGCGNNPGGNSVQAGSTSPIPVRLISQ